jgi:hypothetical protein
MVSECSIPFFLVQEETNVKLIELPDELQELLTRENPSM